MKLFSLAVRPSRFLSATVVLAALTAGQALAAPATGPLGDRTLTLVNLDAQYLLDPSQGAHFAGARAISILDATISAYFYQNGGNYRYYSVRPFIPLIEVGNGTQVAQETDGTVGPSAGSNGTFPIDGGGTVGVGIGYSGKTHAAANLASGILRNSASYGLDGPGVAKTPAPPYDGFGAQGSATSSSEIADYVTTSADTTLTLSGVWNGQISANPPGSFVPSSAGSPTVIATGPNLAEVLAHMEISIYSAPQVVHHTGGEDGEGGSYDTLERHYIGGVSIDRQAGPGDSLTIHEPFSVTIVVPKGDFYFYASQSLNSGGGSDPSRGLGGSVYAQVETRADFEHTLHFNLTPDTASGATLTSESGEFLTQASPLLEQALSGDQVVLTWLTATATGFGLQTSSSLEANASWSAITSGITQTGDHYTFTAPASGTPVFYRLTKQ